MVIVQNFVWAFRDHSLGILLLVLDVWGNFVFILFVGRSFVWDNMRTVDVTSVYQSPDGSIRRTLGESINDLSGVRSHPSVTVEASLEEGGWPRGGWP